MLIFAHGLRSGVIPTTSPDWGEERLCIMITLRENITDKWYMWNRDEALVLIEGKFYSDINHQYAMESFAKDYWQEKGYALDDESDMGEAIRYTDHLFRKGEIHGFDLFSDRDNNKYLISHYKRVFEDASLYKLILDYAKKYNYRIGTFTAEDKLGGECFLI